MLEANKSKWFERLFSVYNRNLFKRRFHSLRVRGLGKLFDVEESLPVIIYANHSSWWDGLVIFEILSRTNLRHHVLMEEKQLRNLKLFRKLGAFSVVRENPREALKSINYAVGILKQNPENALVIFPQGEILPNDIRPIRFYNGMSKIVEKVKSCYLVPIALRYEFLNDFKPEIFVNVGQPRKFNESNAVIYKAITKNSELELTKLLSQLNVFLSSNNIKDFHKVL